jgi:hypothetical protein
MNVLVVCCCGADVAAVGGVPGVAPIDCVHAVAGVPTLAGFSSVDKNYKAQVELA